MIFEIIEWLRTQCASAGITTAYQDYIPAVEMTNVCAVRTTTDSDSTKSLLGKTVYNEQIFDILYRGTSDRKASINIMSAVFDAVDGVYNQSLANSRIVSTDASQPVFAFRDENDKPHYSLTVTIVYEKV